MLERRRIVDLWKAGRAQALVTLVRVEGSSYRRPGARLLLTADGAWAGSVSGGCLEAEVVRKAAWLTRAGAVVERYSTLFDDTAEMPYGLGCGGTVDLLLEPAGTPEFTALMTAMEGSLGGDARRVATYLPQTGHRLLRCVSGADGYSIFRSEDDFAGSSLPLFDEWLTPPQRLFVVGAGDDAQPVVQMASLLGWSVFVLDGRPQWARPERFPGAERVLVPAAPECLTVRREDAVVLMTHSFEQDRDWLAAMLPQQPRYLGLLGARHRSALLVAEVAARLGWSVERVCERMFAPVGLDLGGDGAEAIALSIVAEIQACCEGRLGAVRRLTAEIVAAQIAAGGASRYLQAQCAV